MFGREHELEVVRDLVQRAMDGNSGSLLVRGPSGIGKSTLLAAAAAEAAADGCTVLSASGVESESTVAWSGLSDLLRPVTDDLADLPPAQEAALRGALAIGPAVEPDRFAIGIATLGLLAAAATRAPVVVLVDDVQWLDTASAEALLFAVRRLSAEGVVVLVAERDDVDHPHDLSWLGRVELRGLSPGAAEATLRDRAPGPIAHEVVERILEAAAGNALALVELPLLLTTAQLSGASPLPEPLPVPESLEAELTRRVRSLPDETRRALTVAAAHGGDGAGPIVVALGSLGLSLAHLDAAEHLGVVHMEGGHVSFTHPLIRSAAYHAAPAGERRAAHAALAEALADEPSLEARARHLAAAVLGTDEAVAGELEQASKRARRQGALIAASDLAAKASALSRSADERIRRRIDAADLALLGGATSQALALLDAAGPIDDPGLRIRAAQVRGHWHVVAGASKVGAAALKEVADETASHDPVGAARLLVLAAATELSAGRHGSAAELARRARELAGEAQPDASMAEMTDVASQIAAGAPEDGARLLRLYGTLGDDDELLDAAQPVLLAAVAGLIWLEDFDGAETIVDAVVASARRRSALGVLPLALIHRAWVHIRRADVAAAQAAATEALELAEATGQHTVALVAKQNLAHGAALGGRPEDARLLATEVRSLTEGRSLTPVRYNATMALAHVEMSVGSFPLAIELLEEIVDPDSTTPFFQNPAAFGAANHLVEAYAGAGRHDEARALLGRLAGAVAGMRQPWPRGQLERLRGLLAEEDYDEHFAVAVELLAPTRSAEVWARVSWAQRLRLDGRHDEARNQLHQAFALARRSGYHGHTAQILQELAALGEPVVAAPDQIGMLTGQELAVVTAAAGGASIARTAAELFLSPQTVERDLMEACRKLGVTEPADLHARLAGMEATPGEKGWFIKVLGPCRVRRDGAELPVPAGRAGSLLQLLATLGGSVPVEQAIEHLWPEVDPDVGRVRIRNVLTRLRQALGEVIRRDGELLSFAEAVTVDATAFLADADAALAMAPQAEARASAATEALRWYGGSLLPEASYEPWAEVPRRRLHLRYLQLLDLLAAEAELHGRWDDAARYLELAIEAEPDDHERYLTAAEVRLRQGRRSKALQLCRRARERATELGVPCPAGLDDLELTVLG